MPRNMDTSAAVAANRRRKHERWAKEMNEHRWDALPPGELAGILREIRREISQIEVESSSGLSARARALTVLFNAERKYNK